MTVVLWHIELSHYSEKARWALDFKRVAHRRRAPMPGLHGPLAWVLTGGAQRTLPVLELDGRRIGDSTAIVGALEEYAPEPALYPADPEERARALELEDFFDEQLAPEVRRFVWQHTLADPDTVAAALFTRPAPVRARLLRMLAPVGEWIVRHDYDVSEASADAARTAIIAAMDRLGSEIQPSGDLSAAALFTPLLSPPQRPYMPTTFPEPVMELRRELDARPGGAWVAEMYARHRGAYGAPRTS